MTDIHTISEITGLSLRTLRVIDKHGFLKVTRSSDPLLDATRANLKKGNRLTVLQRLNLLTSPAARASLDRWQHEINDTLRALGEFVTDEAAPWQLSSKIDLAARRDPDAVAAIAAWLREFIDRSPYFDDGKERDYYFLGVRLLADVPEHQLENCAKQLRPCMWQCRASGELEGYSRLEKSGSTIYFRPKAKIPLDL